MKSNSKEGSPKAMEEPGFWDEFDSESSSSESYGDTSSQQSMPVVKCAELGCYSTPTSKCKCNNIFVFCENHYATHVQKYKERTHFKVELCKPPVVERGEFHTGSVQVVKAPVGFRELPDDQSSESSSGSPKIIKLPVRPPQVPRLDLSGSRFSGSAASQALVNKAEQALAAAPPAVEQAAQQAPASSSSSSSSVSMDFGDMPEPAPGVENPKVLSRESESSVSSASLSIVRKKPEFNFQIGEFAKPEALQISEVKEEASHEASGVSMKLPLASEKYNVDSSSSSSSSSEASSPQAERSSINEVPPVISTVPPVVNAVPLVVNASLEIPPVPEVVLPVEELVQRSETSQRSSSSDQEIICEEVPAGPTRRVLTFEEAFAMYQRVPTKTKVSFSEKSTKLE